MPLDMILSSPWAPVLIALTIAGSAVFPPLPSETALVTAASLALTDGLELALVIVATTTGALLGDLVVYALGRTFRRPARARATRSLRGQAALQWLDDRNASWGAGLIIAARFVPGGTTAVGLSAGLLAYPLRRFLLAAAAGSIAWTGYGLALAGLGHAAFPNSTWISVLLALGLTILVAAVLSSWRANHQRRHSTPPTDTESDDR